MSKQVKTIVDTLTVYTTDEYVCIGLHYFECVFVYTDIHKYVFVGIVKLPFTLRLVRNIYFKIRLPPSTIFSAFLKILNEYEHEIRIENF